MAQSLLSHLEEVSNAHFWIPIPPLAAPPLASRDMPTRDMSLKISHHGQLCTKPESITDSTAACDGTSSHTSILSNRAPSTPTRSTNNQDASENDFKLQQEEIDIENVWGMEEITFPTIDEKLGFSFSGGRYIIISNTNPIGIQLLCFFYQGQQFGSFYYSFC